MVAVMANVMDLVVHLSIIFKFIVEIQHKTEQQVEIQEEVLVMVLDK